MNRSLVVTLLGLSGLFFVIPRLIANEAAPGEEKIVLTVEVPRLRVSEYHRPYVAMWIQNSERKVAANLAVWYQIDGPQEDFGTKWLPDLRQWWRRSGRNLEFPVDGLTSATRPAGEHTLTFRQSDLGTLSPGKYTLLVEAVREVGGREVVEIPFTWPSKKATTTQKSGSKELGKITLTVKP